MHFNDIQIYLVPQSLQTQICYKKREGCMYGAHVPALVAGAAGHREKTYRLNN
jgi:hypothetical protein